MGSPFTLFMTYSQILILVMTLSLLICEDTFLDANAVSVLFYLYLRISRRQFPTFDAELNISDDPTFPVSIQDKSFIFVRLPGEDTSSQFSKSNHHSCKYKLLCYIGSNISVL